LPDFREKFLSVVKLVGFFLNTGLTWLQNIVNVKYITTFMYKT